MSSEYIYKKFYFFTNITGNFLEDWNELHKENPELLFKKLPARTKALLDEKDFLKNDLNQFILFIDDLRIF